MTAVAPAGAELQLPVARSTLLGAVVLAVAVLPAVLWLPHDQVSAGTTLPFVGWLVVGVAGAVALDHPSTRAVGWACVVSAWTPTVLGLVGDRAVLGLEAALWAPSPVWASALVLVCFVSWRGARTSRSSRRWSTWTTAACGGAGATWLLAVGTPSTVTRGVCVLALVVLAGVVAASATAGPPRPVDEPLLDIGLALGVTSLAVGTGVALHAFARSQTIAGAEIQAVVAAALVLGLAVPGALRIRRDLMVRRYGTGVLTRQDVARITADLGVADDPRTLLPQAASMVATAAGLARASIVLDDAAPEPGMLAVPLRASSELVGTLLVSSDGDDGLEPRRERVVAQLLPTVVLVVRAVGLALVAQDSRNDLARQRERERARILQDLHDDLGPALAGMSMRVRAAQTDAPSDLLVMLATDLATCRADLRRIVQGLAPHALAEGDVAGALHDLVGSFRTPAGPVVALDGAVPDDIPPEYAVVLYRVVAEGMSNALRHAHPTHVRASLTRVADALTAVVEDDGRAPGPVVPGVGLTSLGARARELGGSLVLEPVEPCGTRLQVTLPEPTG